MGELEAGDLGTLSASILRALIGETLSLDEIIARVGGSPAETLTELALLELRGAVARSPGGLYRSNCRSPPRGP
jgi:predicted Rossmann fold nucleotide-binding protein DprA/Smf involved in DNA uptake